MEKKINKFLQNANPEEKKKFKKLVKRINQYGGKQFIVENLKNKNKKKYSFDIQKNNKNNYKIFKNEILLNSIKVIKNKINNNIYYTFGDNNFFKFKISKNNKNNKNYQVNYLDTKIYIKKEKIDKPLDMLYRLFRNNPNTFYHYQAEYHYLLFPKPKIEY